MKYYTYYLGHGVFPLDWEVCFPFVSDYKQQLADKYQANKKYNDHVIGSLDKLYLKIDTLLEYALADFQKNFVHNHELRLPPMIFPLPKGDFAIILKRDEDGDTVVYSPIPLTYLSND